jgi:hypothetical protein
MGDSAMKRQLSRILLAFAAGFFLTPLDVLAQTSAKVYRIGVLDMELPDLSSPSQRAFYDELRQRWLRRGPEPYRRAPQRNRSA